MQAVFLDDEQQVNAFVETVSKARLSRYLQQSGGDIRQALRLYHWNSQLSQALYLPLQSWEISLRNKLNAFFIFKYSARWPYDSRAKRNFIGGDRAKLDEAIKRQEDASGGTATTDEIVADLSAGFWVSQLGASYAAQYGWKHNIKWRVFPNDHSIDRDAADAICTDLLDLRNRVAHHEPILHLPLDLLRADLDKVLKGMCTATAAYMASACSFSDIWNNPPSKHPLLGEIEAKKA